MSMTCASHSHEAHLGDVAGTEALETPMIQGKTKGQQLKGKIVS